jgi:predicted site-specific integrase-resolvase
MKLSEYAKKIGVTYRTSWNHYKAGMIPNAKKLPSGLIIVDDEVIKTKDRTAVYARVSSSENKANLLSKDEDSKSL